MYRLSSDNREMCVKTMIYMGFVRDVLGEREADESTDTDD